MFFNVFARVQFVKDWKIHVFFSDTNNTKGLPPHSKEKQDMGDDHIGIIVGALAAFVLILFVVICIIILRHKRRKNGSNHRIKQSFDPGHVTLNLHDLQPPVANGKISNGNKYNSLATTEDPDQNGTLHKNLNGDVYPERFDVIQARKLPELPKTPESTGNA